MSAKGYVTAGMLVEPRRGRLLAFSSGSENVHAALQATHGYRALIQVWWGCRDPLAPRADQAARATVGRTPAAPLLTKDEALAQSLEQAEDAATARLNVEL